LWHKIKSIPIIKRHNALKKTKNKNSHLVFGSLTAVSKRGNA
jgi:hypothetical protein